MAIQTLGLSPPERRSTPFDNPAIPLIQSANWAVFGGGHDSAAAEVVNPETAMGQATVNSCVRLLSESIASMNPILFERSDKGKLEAFDNPLHDLLCVEPNPESTAFSLWDSFVASIALWGNGYLEIQRDGTGTIQGLWFLPPSTVTPNRQSDGLVVYRVTQGMSAGQFRVLQAKQVIHVPWHSVDGVTGVSVIAQARNVIGKDIAMDKYGSHFFRNNATPSGVLSTTMKTKPEDRLKMRQEWEAMHTAGNQHRVAVLDQDLKFQSISIPNDDSQWIEAMGLSRQQICGLFKIMPSMIGDTARVAGETYESQQMGYLTHTLRPWTNRIAQELTRKLLRGLPQYSIVHDASDLMKLDYKTQSEAFAQARNWGILTSNECREAFGKNPGGPECDIFLCPANMIDARKLLAPPEPTVVEGTENV